jgi:superfamily I DNA/RNA helicase
MEAHKMTPEQEAIVEATCTTRNNIMINALAGTGKSATLKMIDRVHKVRPCLYCVFNKRNAEEAVKSGEFRDTTVIKTFNALGHGIWRTAISQNITLDKSKSRTLWREMLDEMSRADANAAWREYSVVMDGLEKAKALGYVPPSVKLPHTPLINRTDFHRSMDEPPNEYAAELIDTLLTTSITKAYSGCIDFNDQIYMPALFGGTFPRFPRVMVDEYQDQSPCNHAMLTRLVKGCLIGVGDPFQNIYGFRGAKADGMQAACEAYSMTQMPLSVSFRCPQRIVEHARWRVPHFQWTKEGGNVITLDRFNGPDMDDDTVVICRNNAPLLALAFRLLSVGRSVSMAGSDIGPKLCNILRKLGPSELSRSATVAAINEWEEARVLAGSRSAADMAQCMRIFAQHGDSLGQAISYAEHIFAQEGSIRLLTGHKSKGLEFDNVYFLDPWLLKDDEQDCNLTYVIQTRSQNSLTMLNSADIRWDAV